MNGHHPPPVTARLRWRLAGASLAILMLFGATAAGATAQLGDATEVIDDATSTAGDLVSGGGSVSVGGGSVSVGGGSVSVGGGGGSVSAGGSLPGGGSVSGGGSSSTGTGSTAGSGSTGTGSGSTSGSPGSTTVTVTRAGTVTTLAPGFAPAAGQFRLLEPPPPPATVANLLVPFPVVLIEGSYTPRGVRVRRLSVQAPPGATTRIICIGRRCPRRGMRQGATAAAGPLRAVRFRRFQRRFSAGVSISIYVTKAGKIGKYTRFRVRKGKPPTRTDACVSGTARKPSPCPTA